MTQKKSCALIIDDEPQIRKLLRIVLEDQGFRVEESSNGREALAVGVKLKPDIVILDLGLPDLDGKYIIQSFREWSTMPIVVLSVRDSDEEIIAALDAGADDYITKPFSSEVLLARARANLRKSVTQNAGQPELANGDIRMDLVKHKVYVRDKILPLTPKEYDLLRIFMMNLGRIITHKQLLEEIWGPSHYDDREYLRVYVSQLREKIESNPREPKYLLTEPGIGYRMETVDEPAEMAAVV